MEIFKIEIVKRGDSFVGHQHFGKNHYLELGFTEDSNFEKIKEGSVVYATRVSKILTVKGGEAPCSWSFFKVF